MKRKTLTLTDRAADLLGTLAGYHDQGLFVSQLIEAAATQEDRRAQVEQADLPTLRKLLQEVLVEVAILRAKVERKEDTK